MTITEVFEKKLLLASECFNMRLKTQVSLLNFPSLCVYVLW